MKNLDNFIRLKNIFKSANFNEFYSKINKIKKDINKPYKSYIGVNIKNSELIDIKFYFTFLHEISIEEINLVFDLQNKEIIKNYYHLRKNIFDPKIGGSGYTFSIKFNMVNDNFNTGIYFLIDSHISDFLNLKEIQKYIHLNKAEPRFNNRKMIYLAFDENKQLVEKRQLFYITENNIKVFLANYFNEPFIEEAHEVELCTKDNEYRKINLLINLPDFQLKFKYTKKGASIQQFISNNSWLNGYIPVCPGFYSDIDVNSIYFLNSGDIEAKSIETVEDLFAKTQSY
jgi:hypothetical protein